MSITCWANKAIIEEQMGLDSLLIERAKIPVGHITGCDLFPGLDVFLWDEDEDLEPRIIQMIRIGNTGMVDAGQSDWDR